MLQFDEEFSARQEAQAESQKKEEKIKELEGKIQALESQVNPFLLYRTMLHSPEIFIVYLSPKNKKTKIGEARLSKTFLFLKWKTKNVQINVFVLKS